MLVRNQIKTLNKSWCIVLSLWLHLLKKTIRWCKDSSPRFLALLGKSPQACKILSPLLPLNRYTERDGSTNPWWLWGKSGEEDAILMALSLPNSLLKVTWSSAAASSASLKLSFKKGIPYSCNVLNITKKDLTLATSRSSSNLGPWKLYILTQSKRSAKQMLPQNRAMKNKMTKKVLLP